MERESRPSAKNAALVFQNGSAQPASPLDGTTPAVHGSGFEARWRSHLNHRGWLAGARTSTTGAANGRPGHMGLCET